MEGDSVYWWAQLLVPAGCRRYQPGLEQGGGLGNGWVRVFR